MSRKVHRDDMANHNKEEQETVVLKYAKRRFIQAERAGGLEDPFLDRRQIRRKFGHGGWDVVVRLLERGEIIDASEGQIDFVIHKMGRRISDMCR